MSKITTKTALIAALKTAEEALTNADRAIEPGPNGMPIEDELSNDDWCLIQERLARIAIRSMEALIYAEPDSVQEMEKAIGGLQRDFHVKPFVR